MLPRRYYKISYTLYPTSFKRIQMYGMQRSILHALCPIFSKRIQMYGIQRGILHTVCPTSVKRIQMYFCRDAERHSKLREVLTRKTMYLLDDIKHFCTDTGEIKYCTRQATWAAGLNACMAGSHSSRLDHVHARLNYCVLSI